MVQNFRKNFEGFINNQVEKEILAHKVQSMIGNPTDTNFKPMASKKPLRNSPVKVEDVNNELSIFGPDLEGVRGKTARTKQERVKTDVVQIPRVFYKLNKFVFLMEDVMFVNSVNFLNILSSNIVRINAEHVS